MAAPPVSVTLATIRTLESEINTMRENPRSAELEPFVEKLIILANAYLQMIEEYRENVEKYDAPYDKAYKMYRNLLRIRLSLRKAMAMNSVSPATEFNLQQVLGLIQTVPSSLSLIKVPKVDGSASGTAANPIVIDDSPKQSVGAASVRDPSTDAQDQRRFDMQRSLMEELSSPSTPPPSEPTSGAENPSQRSLELGELLLYFSENPVVRPRQLDFGGAPAGSGTAFQDLC